MAEVKTVGVSIQRVMSDGDYGSRKVEMHIEATLNNGDSETALLRELDEYLKAEVKTSLSNWIKQ